MTRDTRDASWKSWRERHPLFPEMTDIKHVRSHGESILAEHVSSTLAAKKASVSDFTLELSVPKRLPRQHGSSVKFTIRQRNDAGIFVKVSKMTITIYQNITP